MGDIDFEEQIELERLEKEKREKDGHPAEKVDPDGTVYEWDYDKKAWFPKIDAAFIAQYQMNYGVDGASQENKTADNQEKTTGTAPQSYQDYYNYAQAAGMVEAVAVETGKESSTGEQTEYQEDSAEVMAQYTPEQKKQYNEYWSYYYGTDLHDYYTDCIIQHAARGNAGEQADTAKPEDAENQSMEKTTHDSAWNEFRDKHTDETADENKGEKKAKKRKKPPQPKREEGWFEVEKKHNTNVYVSGLPPDMTQEEFTETMAKYGLIMFDPRTKKPKVKLYTDEKGQPKGDGRCCFIKRESVDLALSLLDGLEIRGHTVKVEMASFQMKGDYDPAKKKKKLSNKEKNRMRERQAKLFDWRPDKPRNARQKHEKVVVLKNIFDAKVFEDNPVEINKVSASIRAQCEQFGTVKKVVVYDRHQDGVVIVHFQEPEEADMCVEYMNRRFLSDRRVLAETWDGQTKYEVSETEAEREARLKKWEQFLESGGEGERPSGTVSVLAGAGAGAQGSQNGASVGVSGSAVGDSKNGASVESGVVVDGGGSENADVEGKDGVEKGNSVDNTVETVINSSAGRSAESADSSAKNQDSAVDNAKEASESAEATNETQGENKDVEMTEAETEDKTADTAD